MSDSKKPQYLNADGSFTRSRPGLPKQQNRDARTWANQLAKEKPKKIDAETAKKIADTLKLFLK